MHKLLPASPADKERVNALYNEAKKYFKQNNIDQWQAGYPNEDSFLQDVERGESFVVKHSNAIVATFMCSCGAEPTYSDIYNGNWQYSGEYAVLHRVAVAPEQKGTGLIASIIAFVKAYAEQEGIHYLRCDTHADNISMQRALIKNGFAYSGIIYLDSDKKDARYVYELG